MFGDDLPAPSVLRDATLLTSSSSMSALLTVKSRFMKAPVVGTLSLNWLKAYYVLAHHGVENDRLAVNTNENVISAWLH